MLNFVIKIVAVLILFSDLMIPMFPFLLIGISLFAIIGIIPMSSFLLLTLLYFPIVAYNLFRKHSFKL
jgi:hypothetical protein